MDKETVLDTIDELVAKFLRGDRKDDDDLPLGTIEKLIRGEEITIEDMVDRFRDGLEERLEKVVPGQEEEKDDDLEDEDEDDED
jgi:hypothetical protein